VVDSQAVADSQAEDHSRPGRPVEVVEGSTHPGRVPHPQEDNIAAAVAAAVVGRNNLCWT